MADLCDSKPMPITHIPGRRLTNGESFYTDWTQRGGDSMLLRAELIADVGTSNLVITVEDRTEPGVTPGVVSSEEPGGTAWTLTASSGTGVQTAYYDASMEAQIRLKVECTAGTYVVARIFPPVFFDNAK